MATLPLAEQRPTPIKPVKATEGEKAIATSSTNLLEAAGQSTERWPACFSPASTVGSSPKISATPPQRIVSGVPPPIPTAGYPGWEMEKAAVGVTMIVGDTSATPSPGAITNGVSNQGTQSTAEAESPSLLRPSPVVDLIDKRIKATQKKVVCVKS